MEIVWKCFSRPIPPSWAGGRGSPSLAGPGGAPRAAGGQRSSGRAECPEGGGQCRPGTALPWGSAGGHSPGGFSPGLRWSITSSRRISAEPTALPAPPGTARGEVDTLDSWEADNRGKKRGEPSRRSPSPRTAEEQAFVATEGRGASPGSGGTLPARPGAAPGNKEVNRADSPLVFNYPGGLSVPLRAMKTLCSSLVLAFGSPRDVGW